MPFLCRGGLFIRLPPEMHCEMKVRKVIVIEVSFCFCLGMKSQIVLQNGKIVGFLACFVCLFLFFILALDFSFWSSGVNRK